MLRAWLPNVLLIRPERVSADDDSCRNRKLKNRLRWGTRLHITASRSGHRLQPSRSATWSSMKSSIRKIRLHCRCRSHTLSLSVGRVAVVMPHPWQDDQTSLTGWLLRMRRRIRASLTEWTQTKLRRQLTASGRRDFVIEGDDYDSSFFDKSRPVPEVRLRICGHQQRRYDHRISNPDLASSRLAFRRLSGTDPAPRPAALVCADMRQGGRLVAGALTLDTVGLAHNADGRRHESQGVKAPLPGRTTFGLPQRERPPGVRAAALGA